MVRKAKTEDEIRAQIALWLDEIKSENIAVRRSAIMGVSDIVTPNLLVHGYGQTAELMVVAESPFPEAVIPRLIDLLKDDHIGDKSQILDILFELSLYEGVENTPIPEDKLHSYLDWARRLRSLVFEGIEVYRSLVNSKEPSVATMAKDLIELLEESNKTELRNLS